MARKFFDDEAETFNGRDRKRDRHSAKEQRRQARANKYVAQTQWMETDEE